MLVEGVHGLISEVPGGGLAGRAHARPMEPRCRWKDRGKGPLIRERGLRSSMLAEDLGGLRGLPW